MLTTSSSRVRMTRSSAARRRCYRRSSSPTHGSAAALIGGTPCHSPPGMTHQSSTPGLILEGTLTGGGDGICETASGGTKEHPQGGAGRQAEENDRASTETDANCVEQAGGQSGEAETQSARLVQRAGEGSHGYAHQRSEHQLRLLSAKH
jgi:hypothetical protein